MKNMHREMWPPLENMHEATKTPLKNMHIRLTYGGKSGYTKDEEAML